MNIFRLIFRMLPRSGVGFCGGAMLRSMSSGCHPHLSSALHAAAAHMDGNGLEHMVRNMSQGPMIPHVNVPPHDISHMLRPRRGEVDLG